MVVSDSFVQGRFFGGMLNTDISLATNAVKDIFSFWPKYSTQIQIMQNKNQLYFK